MSAFADCTYCGGEVNETAIDYDYRRQGHLMVISKVPVVIYDRKDALRRAASGLVAESNLIFHPGASENYEAAFTWYFSRGSRVAFDFEQEIERAIRLIAKNPLRWPNFDAEKRRFVVRKFPYSIIYELIDNDIVILAIAHGRRKPGHVRSNTVIRVRALPGTSEARWPDLHHVANPPF